MICVVALALAEDKLVDVTCPVDGFKFKAIQVGFHPAWEGIDRDFCQHASRGSPLELKVWVCPQCYYTGFKSDFEKKIAFKGAAELKPATPIARTVHQKNIPPDTKFDLLAQTRAALGQSAEETAKAYLFGAWAARIRGTVFLDGFEEFEELYSRQGLVKNPLDMKGQNKTDLELKSAAKVETELSRRPMKGLHLQLHQYLLVYLYRKHGENVRALKWIQTLDRSNGENSVIDQAVNVSKHSIEEERHFQRKAVEHFKRAVEAGQVSGKPLAETEYILGELHRRLGDRDAASHWFGKVVAREGPEELKDVVRLAREQMALQD